MQDTERQKFEEDWKSAFDGAEKTPPDRVWSSIELDLAGQETIVMKKRLVFYQRLAAATVLFALLTGVYAFYPKHNGKQEVAVKKEDVKGNEIKSSEIESSEIKEENGRDVNNENNSAKVYTRPLSTKTSLASNGSEGSQTLAAFNEPIAQEKTEENTGTITEEKAKEKIEEKKVAEVIASPLIQELPQEIVERKEKKKQKESLWLAFGGAAGNYTPNTPSASTSSFSQFADATTKGPALFSLVAASTPKPQPKVGAAYSVGIAVGKKFGRVVLQTGINLNRQQIDYTSNYDARTASNSSKAAVSDYLAESTSLTFTNEYTVNSTMETLSIPVQAGYMIIDRKLGWQMNAGVSSDFFIRNVLVDRSGQREKFTQEAGSDSPYRSVNWSALASTELSYRIGTHYRLSLVPGVRYSFHSILKEPTDNGRPVIFDLGFRFKYIFD